MLPAAALMMAAGVIDSLDDLRKPFGHGHQFVHQSDSRPRPPGSNRRHRVRGTKSVWFQRLVRQRRRRHLRWHRHGPFRNEYSLASRELIADEIETIIGAHPCDAWIGIANCDKIVPAMYNAMVRINIPAVYLSGGPMLAGEGNTDLITVFEAVGKHSAGKMSMPSCVRWPSAPARVAGAARVCSPRTP